MATQKPQPTPRTATFRSVGDGQWELMLPLPPVPAARPRVGRWGTYYPKTYRKWRDETEEMLKRFADVSEPVERGPVYVVIHTVAKRPQRLTRGFPRGDVDNFAKAALDAVTRAGLIWHDDDQVIVLSIGKRYAEPGEQPHTYLFAATGDDGFFGEDVYDLPAKDRVSLDELENTADDETV